MNTKTPIFNWQTFERIYHVSKNLSVMTGTSDTGRITDIILNNMNAIYAQNVQIDSSSTDSNLVLTYGIYSPSQGFANGSTTVPMPATGSAISAKLKADLVAFAASTWSITITLDYAVIEGDGADIPTAPISYQTIVSQTGTAAPAVSGGFTPTSTYASGVTFTWARTGAGVYTITASSAVFTVGKTGVFVAPLQNLNGSVRAVVTSSTVITVTTAVQSLAVLGLLGFTATNTDALLNGTMIYVQTYA